MFGFTATTVGYASRIHPAEREILARLVEDVSDLVADGARPVAVASDDPIAHLDFDPDTAEIPSDPALARLFPPMAVGDPDLATELRGLTMDGLRRAKLANLDTVARALATGAETVLVRRGEERLWLAALTDIRLVLAARLQIVDDSDSQRVHSLAVAAARGEEPDDERVAALASLYSGITWWQESLLQAVTGGLPSI